VAAVRPGTGFPPPLRATACPPLAPRAQRGNCSVWRAYFGAKALTRPAPQDYIDPLGRAAAWRDGASAKPLTVSHGDRASGHALCGHVRRRVGCGGLYVLQRKLEKVLRLLPEDLSRRRSCEAPGCLKSESEERETWTAESLRAASRGEAILYWSGFGRDFGGSRLRYIAEHLEFRAQARDEK
jgi:hypothetical protein